MKTTLRFLLAAIAISAPLAACTAPVAGEGAGDDQVAQTQTELTAVDAKFARFVPTPNGKIGGMLLEDGTFVRMFAETAPALQKGDLVHVEGVKKEANVFAHATVSKDGNVLVQTPAFGKHGAHHGKHFEKKAEWKNDPAAKAEWMKKRAEWKANPEAKAEWMKKHANDPAKAHLAKGAWKKHHHGKGSFDPASLEAVSSTAKVAALLPGRHGEPFAVILDDGTVAYAPFRHHGDANAAGSTANKLADLGLKPGDAITVAGKGGNYDVGRALVIESVTMPTGDVKAL